MTATNHRKKRAHKRMRQWRDAQTMDLLSRWVGMAFTPFGGPTVYAPLDLERFRLDVIQAAGAPAPDDGFTASPRMRRMLSRLYRMRFGKEGSIIEPLATADIVYDRDHVRTPADHFDCEDNLFCADCGAEILGAHGFCQGRPE